MVRTEPRGLWRSLWMTGVCWVAVWPPRGRERSVDTRDSAD